MRWAAATCALSAFTLASASGLGPAGEFNAFIFGNASAANGETEGAVAVGGNFVTTGAHVTLAHNYPATLGSQSGIGLYVGGNRVAQGGSLNNGGNGFVGGNFVTSNPYNLNGTGTLRAGGSVVGTVQIGPALGGQLNVVDPTVFTQQKAYSLTQSAYIRSLTATNMDSLIGDPNNLNIDVSSLPSLPGFPTVKLLRTQATSQSAFQNLQVAFNNMGSNTVIVDVVGANVNWKWKMNSSNFNRLLWNFQDATDLLIANDQFRGSILAPSAKVIQERNIEGNLIANEWELRNGVEMHFGNQFQFDGVAPVPEPATMALGGLALAAAIRRRRRSK